jgi:hypothetical protein
VYRRRSGAGAAAQIGFDVNAGVTGALWSGRYQAVAVPAGMVTARVRGVATGPRFECPTLLAGETTQTLLIKRGRFSYLGVFGGPEWETTFQAEAGKEYFVEVANGLRAYRRTEEAAMADNLATLKRSKRYLIFFSKDMAVLAARQVTRDCAANGEPGPIQTVSETGGLRVVD